MLKYFFLFFAICLSFSCTGDKAKTDEKAYLEGKKSLTEQEQTKPLAFLKVHSSKKKNWLGQTVVMGTIANRAAVSSYKDIRIKMLCYNKAGKMVEEHEDLVDDIIKPNSDKTFKLRYRLPGSTDSIELTLMSAGVVK